MISPSRILHAKTQPWSCWLQLLLCLVGLLLTATTAAPSRDNNDHQQPKQSSYLRSRELAPRIVGGSNANANLYPWHVQWEPGCGASLILGDLLLTAAHCYSGTAAGLAELTQEPWWLGSAGPIHTGRELRVDEVYVHPRYTPAEAQIYDFMIARTTTTVTDVAPVKLNANTNYPNDGQPLTVIGYGTLKEDGETPDVLQTLTIPMIGNCTEFDPSGNVRPELQFCAGVPEGGKDACQGDSGGPIMDTSGLQVGTVSWGIGCARPNRPGVYARTAVMTSWLKHITCQHSKLAPSDCMDVQVNIRFNGAAPQETGFSLLDVSNGNQEMVVEPVGSIPAGDFTKTYKVPKGRYIFRIDDSGANGAGAFTVTAAGREFKSDGVFGGTSTTFPVEVGGEVATDPLPAEPEPAATAPPVTDAPATTPPVTEPPPATFAPADEISRETSSPAPPQGGGFGEYQKPDPDGQFAIQVDIRYDARPDLVMWRVVRQETDGSLVEMYQSQPANRFISPSRREVVKIRFLAAGNYAIQIMDSGADGMTVRGHVRVFDIENSSGSINGILWSIRGDAFTDQAEGRFTLG